MRSERGEREKEEGKKAETGRGFETFDHTADIGIRGWGKDIRELFEEMAKALFSVIVDLGTVDCKKTVTVTVKCKDVKPYAPDAAYEDLLLAWLKELLFIFETKRLVFSDFSVTEITSESLTAEGKGELLDPARHSLGREVKAVTLHQFKIEQTASGYFAEAILDI